MTISYVVVDSAPFLIDFGCGKESKAEFGPPAELKANRFGIRRRPDVDLIDPSARFARSG